MATTHTCEICLCELSIENSLILPPEIKICNHFTETTCITCIDSWAKEIVSQSFKANNSIFIKCPN